MQPKNLKNYIDQLYLEFKEEIPGLTKRKLRVLINNCFICQIQVTIEHKPQRYNLFDIEPHPYYAKLSDNMLVIPQDNFTYREKLNKRLENLQKK